MQRCVPLLCLLATVSFPGQAQIAPDDQDPEEPTSSQPVAIAQSDGEDGARTEIRAPMLTPEEAGSGELEVVEPQTEGRRWRKRSAPVTTSELAEAEAQDEQALSGNSVAALSAVPSVASPQEAAPSGPSPGDISEDWPKYGLVISLIAAALFLFWRLGERARVSDYELIGYTTALSDDQVGSATEADSDDQAEPATYESLQEAVRAMKAARKDRS